MMLSSTDEYLKALRDGKYLLFLEWPLFVTDNYAERQVVLAADEILNLLIFEWLNSGFLEDDIKKIALLNAVYELPTTPLRGNLAYAFITISIAMFQCMVYRSYSLEALFKIQDKLSVNEVMQLINQNSKTLNMVAFHQRLAAEQVQFLTLTAQLDRREIAATWLRMSPLLELRSILDDYISALVAVEIKGDLLQSSRISVLIQLAEYLNAQTELRPAVRVKLTAYVKQIRAMQPADFEEAYLSAILPLSFLDNAWRFIARYGEGFFSSLNPRPAAITANAPESNAKI